MTTPANGRADRAIRLAATAETLSREVSALRASRETAEAVSKLAARYRRASPEQLAGRLIEEVHPGTFNIDAALKGRRSLAAQSTAGSGRPHAPADVVIRRAGGPVAEAQLKSRATPVRTTFDISRPSYDGMQKVVPADQLDAVRGLASRRGASGTGQRNYPDTARAATDRLSFEGVESRPMTRAEALDLAQRPGDVMRQLQRERVIATVKSGAFIGAGVSGLASGVRNTAAVLQGEKEVTSAALDTLVDSAKGGVGGALMAGTTVAAQQGMLRVGLRAASRGSAPVAVAVTVLSIGADIAAVTSGELSGSEAATRATKHVATGAALWGGMELGVAVGTAIFPGVGTIVGGLLGGALGCLGIDALFSCVT